MKSRPNLLDDATIANATDNDRVYNDGGDVKGCALEIHVRLDGRSKIGRFRYNGLPFGENRTSRVTIGSYAELGLRGLRRKRVAYEALIEKGKSPKRHSHEVKQEREKFHRSNISLREAIEEHFAHCREKRWGKYAAQTWGYQKPKYLDPISNSDMGSYPLRSIDHTHVFEWLEPTRKQRGIQQKLHSFFHGLFERNIARRRYEGPNPASWRHDHPLYELLTALPPQGRHPDMAVDDVPLVVADLMTEIESSRPGFLTPAEAAFAYALDSTAIYSATKKGRFPGLIKGLKGKNHNLIPVDELKATYGEFKREPILNEREEVRLCAYALLFVMLTVVRASMARELKWGQIKWDEGIIEYLPATPQAESQHKSGHHFAETYIVILTDGVRKILQAMREWAQENELPMGDDDYVFAHGRSRVGLNVRHGQPLSMSALLGHLKRRLKSIRGLKNPKASPHSVRNAFPKWAYEIRGYGHELIDVTLGHRIPPLVLSITNKAYFRGIQFLKRRRKMMASWETFAFSRRPQQKAGTQPQKAGAKVLSLPRPASA
jgi:integrase